MLRTSIRICLMGIALYCIPVSAQAAKEQLCMPLQVRLVAGSSARVVVICKSRPPGGMQLFSYLVQDNPEVANMLLNALISKKHGPEDWELYILYEPTDTSGAAWGCPASNCRRILRIRW